MKIFVIICVSIMFGIAFVDMVAVFTNFVEKSKKKEWVKNFFIILQMIFLVVFLCVAIIGIIILL